MYDLIVFYNSIWTRHRCKCVVKYILRVMYMVLPIYTQLITGEIYCVFKFEDHVLLLVLIREGRFIHLQRLLYLEKGSEFLGFRKSYSQAT